MSAAVLALAAAGSPQPVELVVRYDEHPELFDDQRIAELGGTVTRVYSVLDMRAIRLPAEALVELTLEQNVARLSLGKPISESNTTDRSRGALRQRRRHRRCGGQSRRSWQHDGQESR